MNKRIDDLIDDKLAEQEVGFWKRTNNMYEDMMIQVSKLRSDLDEKLTVPKYLGPILSGVTEELKIAAISSNTKKDNKKDFHKGIEVIKEKNNPGETSIDESASSDVEISKNSIPSNKPIIRPQLAKASTKLNLPT